MIQCVLFALHAKTGSSRRTHVPKTLIQCAKCANLAVWENLFFNLVKACEILFVPIVMITVISAQGQGNASHAA